VLRVGVRAAKWRSSDPCFDHHWNLVRAKVFNEAVDLIKNGTLLTMDAHDSIVRVIYSFATENRKLRRKCRRC